MWAPNTVFTATIPVRSPKRRTKKEGVFTNLQNHNFIIYKANGNEYKMVNLIPTYVWGPSNDVKADFKKITFIFLT